MFTNTFLPTIDFLLDCYSFFLIPFNNISIKLPYQSEISDTFIVLHSIKILLFGFINIKKYQENQPNLLESHKHDC